MAGNIKLKPLGFVAKVRSGFAFNSDDMGTVGHPIIKIRNVVPPRVEITDCERVSEEVILRIPNVERFELQEGDTLIAMTGATVGKVGKFPRVKERYFLNQRVGKVYLTDEESADYRYLYYVLSQDRYVREMFGVADGSAQANISGSQIENLEIPLPALKKQKEIASILGTLDDKIELNRRMNATLEAMARALFQSWFVDAVEGGLPEGWREGLFTDVVDVIGGGTPKTSVAEYWDGDIPWFSIADVKNENDVFVISTVKHISASGMASSSTRLLPKGTTIITARGTVGKVALTGVPMAMNQSCYGLVGKFKNSSTYTYFATRNSVETLRQRTHGSVFDTITQETLAGIEVSTPPEKLVVRFEERVASTMNLILNNLHESRTLAALRDVLLPRLMSGEINVDKI